MVGDVEDKAFSISFSMLIPTVLQIVLEVDNKTTKQITKIRKRKKYPVKKLGLR